MEKNTTRTKISNFVKQVRDVGGPGALLGGESLPPTLVYEEMLTHFSDRPLFHLDGEIKLTEEHVLETMREAMEKGGALLVTLTMKVGSASLQTFGATLARRTTRCQHSLRVAGSLAKG